MSSSDVSFLFDLDGTLVDSVYQHVLAWQEALHAAGIELSVWRIHRKIGMSGGLFTEMLLRETSIEITPSLLETLQRQHAEAYGRLARWVRPLPGAIELLRYLTETRIPWSIATSARMNSAKYNLAALHVDPAQVPVIDVQRRQAVLRRVHAGHGGDGPGTRSRWGVGATLSRRAAGAPSGRGVRRSACWRCSVSRRDGVISMDVSRSSISVNRPPLHADLPMGGPTALCRRRAAPPARPGRAGWCRPRCHRGRRGN